MIPHGLLILMMLIGLSGQPARAGSDDFTTGITAMEAGDFSGATAQFETLSRQQPSVGAFLNLGLAEWRRGRAGAAILAWERAQWIDPLNRQAKRNLDFARAVAQVDAPQLRWFESVSTWLPANWWLWLAGVSLWITAGALVLPRFFRWRKAGWQSWVTALGLAVFLFSVTGNVGVMSRSNLGFILKKQTALRLVPAKTSEANDTLAAGEPVRRLKSRGEFFLVRTAQGTGWIIAQDAGWLNGVHPMHNSTTEENR